MARGGKLHRLRLGIRTYGEQHPMNSYMIVACIFCIFGGLCLYLYEGGGQDLLLMVVCSCLGIADAIDKTKISVLLKGLAIKDKWHLRFYVIAIFLFLAMAFYVWVKAALILHRTTSLKIGEDFMGILLMLASYLFVGAFFYTPLCLLLRGIIRNWTLHSGYNKRY